MPTEITVSVTIPEGGSAVGSVVAVNEETGVRYTFTAAQDGYTGQLPVDVYTFIVLSEEGYAATFAGEEVGDSTDFAFEVSASEWIADGGWLEFGDVTGITDDEWFENHPVWTASENTSFTSGSFAYIHKLALDMPSETNLSTDVQFVFANGNDIRLVFIKWGDAYRLNFRVNGGSQVEGANYASSEVIQSFYRGQRSLSARGSVGDDPAGMAHRPRRKSAAHADADVRVAGEYHARQHRGEERYGRHRFFDDAECYGNLSRNRQDGGRDARPRAGDPPRTVRKPASFAADAGDAEKVMDAVNSLNASYSANYKNIRNENILALHRYGINVNGWTIGDMFSLFAPGFDAVTTDYCGMTEALPYELVLEKAYAFRTDKSFRFEGGWRLSILGTTWKHPILLHCR